MAVLREVESDKTYPLRGKALVIGRDQACDIVVNTPQTSGRHTLLVEAGGTWYVEDLGSVNGTFVNGARIEGRTPLRPGDRLALHGLTVTYHEGAAEDSTGSQTLFSARPPSILSSLDLTSGLRVEVDPAAKLRAVLQISNNLAGTLDLRQVLPKTLDSLFAIFPQADRGLVLLRDPDLGELVPRAVRHRDDQASGRLEYSQTIVAHALTSGRAVLSSDAGQDQRFDPSQSIRRLQIHSIMCVPMLGQAGARLGVIQLETRDWRLPFREEDLDVLVSAAAQAARSLELARLHEEQRDLEAATQIQKSFLPHERPQVPGLQFFDYYVPAQRVGGDYYDYIRLPGNRLGLAVGDVSGKGVSAALLMARLSAAARFALASAPTLPEAVAQLNTTLIRPGTEDRFITCVVAVVDLDHLTLSLVNAGHLPPLLRRADGTVEELGEAVAGLPLGVLDRPYQEATLPLGPGEAVVFYTDGVTEARNPRNEMYGVDQLKKVVEKGPGEAEALGTAVLDDLQRFVAGRPAHDDVTLLCLRRV
jgi:serine phosphatase RsbU (regulator of sigma subunit)